jgi:hypothetical protein
MKKLRTTEFRECPLSLAADFSFFSLLSKNINIKTYRSTILPVILYECETRSVTLTEERRLREFENSVLRKLLGPNKEEVTREWRRLHKEELYVLYSSPNTIRVIKSRRIRWAGHVTLKGREKRCIEDFGGEA